MKDCLFFSLTLKALPATCLGIACPGHNNQEQARFRAFGYSAVFSPFRKVECQSHLEGLASAGLGWPRNLVSESHVELTGDNQQHLPPLMPQCTTIEKLVGLVDLLQICTTLGGVP